MAGTKIGNYEKKPAFIDVNSAIEKYLTSIFLVTKETTLSKRYNKGGNSSSSITSSQPTTQQVHKDRTTPKQTENHPH